MICFSPAMEVCYNNVLSYTTENVKDITNNWITIQSIPLIIAYQSESHKCFPTLKQTIAYLSEIYLWEIGNFS